MLQLKTISNLVLGCLTISVIAGCAGHPFGSSSDVDYRKRAAQLARELKRKNAVIETLREQNQVLGTKVHQASTGRVTSSDSASVIALSPSNQPIPSTLIASNLPDSGARVVPRSPAASVTHLPVELPKQLPQKKPKVVEAVAVSVPTENGEHLLYGKVMDTYRKHDLSEMQTAVRLFLKTYPDSAYADNALYLNGLLATQNNEFSSAIRIFDQLLRDYATSNKAVSALFAKGSLYRNQKQWSKARRCFSQIQNLYPGSAESLRVPLELRLIAQLEKTGTSTP